VELEALIVELEALYTGPETFDKELTTFVVGLGILMLEVEANFVAIDGFVVELFLSEPESTFVELELFPAELDGFLVAVEGLLVELESTFVEVDARFTELEARLVLELELVDLLAELETIRLVGLEPRIGLMSRDEVEALLDVLAILTEDVERFELEGPWLEPDLCVDVVGRWEVVFWLVDFERGAPRITEAAFCVDVFVIRPLLVTRTVLLFFAELLLIELCVRRVTVVNARRGNIIVLEVENSDDMGRFSRKCSSESSSIGDSEDQSPPVPCHFLSGIWLLLERNGDGISGTGTNFLSIPITESFLAPDASNSERLRTDGWAWSLTDWVAVSWVAAPDRDDSKRPPDRATPWKRMSSTAAAATLDN
jgi:hypothetical protein